MITKNKAYRLRTLAILLELHYRYGIDFPFPLSYKALKRRDYKIQRKNTAYSGTISHKKPRPIKRYIGLKQPKNFHIVSIWRQR